MVLNEIIHALPIPDPRPTKADPEQRAKRKAHEKIHPHFAMQEFALKAGVLALMGVVAIYPWEKKYDEHVAKRHPERLEKGNDKKAKDKKGRGREGNGRERRRSVGEARRPPPAYIEESSTRGSVDGGRRERRRMSVAENSIAPRQRAYIAEGSRRGSVGPASEAGSQRGRTYAEEARTTGRRQSVDPVALRLAVADGYSYVPRDKGYIDGRRSADADWDKGPREFVQDKYVFRPRRTSRDSRR